MLRRTEELFGVLIRGTDGTMGRIHDLYFDDQSWTVSYLVLHTASWPMRRFALLSPCVVEMLAWDRRQGLVQLTQAQVSGCPNVTLSPTLSRQQCAESDEYFGWPARRASQAADAKAWVEGSPAALASGGSLLQSAREMPAYSLEIEGTEVGRVQDVLFDDVAWTVRYLVVDCWAWSPGRRQLIPPECVKTLDRGAFKVLAEYRHRLAPTG